MSFIEFLAVITLIATFLGVWEWIFKPPRGCVSINWWANPNFRWSVTAHARELEIKQLEARLAELNRDAGQWRELSQSTQVKLTAANERVKELEGRLHEITKDWPHIKLKDEFTVATNPSDLEIAGPRE